MTVAVTPDGLYDWLKKAGIACTGDPENDPSRDHITRVIIDIEVGQRPRIYLTRLGDEQVFKVAPPNLLPARVVTFGGSPRVVGQDQTVDGCGEIESDVVQRD